jgi:hypothetical protein
MMATASRITEPTISAVSAPTAFPTMLGFSEMRELGLAHQKAPFPMSPTTLMRTKKMRSL